VTRVFPLSATGAAADCVGLLSETGPATLRDLSACARFGLKGPGADTWFERRWTLPPINRWVTRDGARLLRLGARDLMVLADPASPAAVEALRADWEAGGEGHSSWREETWAWLRLAGPAAFDVASRLTAVDLRPKAFGPDQILQTRFSHLDAVLLRAGPEDACGLDILFDIAATAQVVRDIASAMKHNEVFG
jgi:sarcosine oxidase subunit gamma